VPPYSRGLAERRASGETLCMRPPGESATPPADFARPAVPARIAAALWLPMRGPWPLLLGSVASGDWLKLTDLLLRMAACCCCCLEPDTTIGELLASRGGVEASSPGTGVVGLLVPCPGPCFCGVLPACELDRSRDPFLLAALDSRGCRASASDSVSDTDFLLLPASFILHGLLLRPAPLPGLPLRAGLLLLSPSAVAVLPWRSAAAAAAADFPAARAVNGPPSEVTGDEPAVLCSSGSCGRALSLACRA
jgi:hypothetical protein